MLLASLDMSVNTRNLQHKVTLGQTQRNCTVFNLFYSFFSTYMVISMSAWDLNKIVPCLLLILTATLSEHFLTNNGSVSIVRPPAPSSSLRRSGTSNTSVKKVQVYNYQLCFLLRKIRLMLSKSVWYHFVAVYYGLQVSNNLRQIQAIVWLFLFGAG